MSVGTITDSILLLMIKNSLDASTALEVRYSFVYLYPDLKNIVLKFVAKNIGDLYAVDQDPYARNDGHP
ncbi:hypothetical protein CPB97_001109 [Podila verticillata]|nr:hypothetical protein CPB97_001109 [Podila verticillata]